MNNNPIPTLAPAGWLESLARSEAQLAAGEIVSGEEVLRELDEAVAQLEATQASGPRSGTVPHR
jgi:hypothetical protein